MERTASKQEPEEAVPVTEMTKEPNQGAGLLPGDGADSPEVSAEETQQRRPAAKTVREDRRPSECAALDSLDKLGLVMRECRSLDAYRGNRPRDPGTEVVAGLLESDRALVRLRDTNRPRANWLLTQLLVNLGDVAERASTPRLVGRIRVSAG